VTRNKQRGATILVVADYEYLRDGIKALLEADGHRVNPARGEADAVVAAKRHRPDLILVTLDQSGDDMSAIARRVRARARLGEIVPIVMFCILTVAEGAEIQVGENTYATRPVNFDQLRDLLSRLIVRLRAARRQHHWLP
jgi:CheY-like chemotaxis protein